jgi:putative phosphoesterase
MSTGLAQIPKALPPSRPEKIIGVISDTHVPVRARVIPQAVFKAFENVDYIIHAGDLVEISVVDELEQIAPVLAVHGNMDGSEVAGAFPKLNSLKTMDWKIGVIHDLRPGLGNQTDDLVRENGFNVLVYGHTHSSSARWVGTTLFLNPGSPTNPEPPFLSKPSVALLKITKEKIIPEIVHL